jgi:RNA polymerase sigma-70 factor (ECF subfamily)
LVDRASLPDSIGEAALLRRLQAGEELAYEILVRRFSGRMLAVAKRLLGNDDDAMDALQDAFVSAVKCIDQFAGHAQLGTWLHRIVVNAALMKLRARKRRQDCSIEEFLPTFEEDGHRRNPRPAWTASSDEILQRRETRALIRRKIDQLPEDYRTVLMLRDIEEMDTEETAALLGISHGAVKTRLHRARMALREILQMELP